MATCRTCGQPIRAEGEAQRLLELLANGVPHREVYRAGDNSGAWYVTYGGGPFSREAVEILRRGGHVQPVYSEIPDECFHIGKTLDCAATQEERKKHRSFKTAPLVYTDGSRGTR